MEGYTPHISNSDRRRVLSLEDLEDPGMPFAKALETFIADRLNEDPLFFLDNVSLQEFWSGCSLKFSRQITYELGIFNKHELMDLQGRLCPPKNVSEAVFREPQKSFLSKVRGVLKRKK